MKGKQGREGFYYLQTVLLIWRVILWKQPSFFSFSHISKINIFYRARASILRGNRFLLLWFFKYIILIGFLDLRIRQQIWNKGKYSWNIKAKGKKITGRAMTSRSQPYWLQDMWPVCGKILNCWKIQVSSYRHPEKLCVRRDSIG